MFAAAVTSQRGRSFAVFGARTPVRRHGQTTIEHEQVIVPELIVAFPVLVKVRLHSPSRVITLLYPCSQAPSSTRRIECRPYSTS